MNQHFEFIFNLFVIYGLIVSVFHLFVRKFISENLDSYNWYFYHRDFKYLRKLKESKKDSVASKSRLYHRALKVGYISLAFVFIALMSAT